jgi:hypothetical protein
MFFGESAARSVHLPDHLVQDQIRVEGDGGSCQYLAARRSLARQSWIGAVPATRSRMRVRFASSSCAACKKVPPVRPKHRAIVGSDRGAGASRELRSEPLSLGNTLRRTRIVVLVRVVRWNLRRRSGVIGIDERRRGRRTVWAERPALTMDERRCWEPRRRHDRCSPWKREALVHGSPFPPSFRSCESFSFRPQCPRPLTPDASASSASTPSRRRYSPAARADPTAAWRTSTA